MFSNYFKDLDKNLIKKCIAQKSSAAKTKDAKTVKSKTAKKDEPAAGSFTIEPLIETVEKLMPVSLSISKSRIIDSAGFSPEGSDFLAYKKSCVDIIEIMGGYLPYELLNASFHVVKKLDRKSMADMLNKISNVKKLGKFSQSEDAQAENYVPAFAFIFETDFSFVDIKNDVTNYYMSLSLDHSQEVDIIVILNRGIMIKNWREKRSFVALETGEDTMMWFFILMNEYLEIEKSIPFDLRSYVKKDVVYKEY